MILCQVCGTSNSIDSEYCKKCGRKLLILAGNQHWEEPGMPRVSMEDHFLERISNLEETVNKVLDHLTAITESLDILDRNAFITKSGLTALIETLNETHLLREELLHQRWESVMVEQMEGDRIRERFNQLKPRFLSLFHGSDISFQNFRALLEEAELQIYSDRLHDSVKTLKKAFALDERNYELAYYLGEISHELGLTGAAINFLEKALNAKADHGDSLLMLALIHYGENHTDQAQVYLERCIEVNTRDNLPKLCLASIFINKEQYEEAKQLLHYINSHNPHAQSYYLLGIIAKEEDRLKDAIDYLENAVNLDPYHDDALFSLGMAYLKRGWNRKAKACFARATELNPSNLEYQEAAQLEPPATGSFTKNFDSESLELWDFARQLVLEGKNKQALVHYRKLLRKNPGNPLLLSTIAIVNFSMRRYEETVKITSQLLQQDVPNTVGSVAYNLQFESLRALQRFDEALQLMEQMLTRFPSGLGAAMAKYGLAMIKAEMGKDLKLAEELASEALEISPPEYKHHAFGALGWVYFKQGRYEESVRSLEAALSMSENINHLYHYGMTLLALDLQDEAAKIFERALRLRSKEAKVDDFLFKALQSEMSLPSSGGDGKKKRRDSRKKRGPGKQDS